MALSSEGLSKHRYPSLFFVLTFLFSFSFLISASASYDPFSAAARCPPPCQNTADHTSWSLYRDASQLVNCDQTILLDLNLNHGLDLEAVPGPIRACLVQEEVAVPDKKKRQSFSFGFSNSTNATTFEAQSQTHDLQIVRWRSEDSNTNGAAVTAATSALAQAVRSQKNGGTSILFAKLGQAIVGVYAGSQIDNERLGRIVQQFADRETGQQTGQTAAQLCLPESLGSQILGIFVDATGDLNSVKAALGSWNNATCLGTGQGETETWAAVTIGMVPGTVIPVGPKDGGTPGNGDSPNDNNGQGNNNNIVKRATCRYTQAVSGDGCYAVAQRCAITQAQLISFNNDPNLCSNLQVGQYVCCSAGTLPDFTPQPNADGTCKSYTVKSGDYCAAIAQANTMTVAAIESRNKNTWGWTGCSYLLVGAVVCLSTGSPPMPGAVANTVCGPTVPGTARPADMSTLARLNPCPLNACCDVWGQCGTTQDFCVPTPADNGAPGTARPGTNGCISGCNMAITNNAAPPSTFIKLGYWEAWNGQRPCLHMKASQIDTTQYTHIHFAFASISATFDVSIGNLTSEFADFKALTGVKRIVSFGGWSFSTDFDTFPIFRQSVTPAQRQAFANKIVAFVVNNGLDGVDFDWEYPGAPDIPGIPPGSPQDGPNYLAFLQLVRAALPVGKTIGLAAPASFWYLKGFPIADMSKVVDYIVYMTYDLHGQWDYGNAWSDDGCPGGNCLRSHVNKTETANALAMITHAGVQASKVLVGMALYGRSFQMTTPGCYGQACTYIGKASGATPGRCTGTAGYISNFEIRDLIETVGNIQQYSSDDGDILVYNSVQWVSWMSKSTYDSRVAWVKGLNFGGTADWAIDLDADYGSSDSPGQGNSGSDYVYVSPDIYTQANPVIQCYPPCTLVLPPFVLSTATTISMEPVTVTYKDTWSTTLTINGAVITTSVGSITSTAITLPPIITKTIYLSNVVWNPTPAGSSASTTTGAAFIWLTSSILPAPVTVTQQQTRSTGPSVIWTYSPGPYPTPPSNRPSPPPPPPGPPPGFPSFVSIQSGPPKPTCRPGQICGFPCLFNCGGGGPPCIICGCIGPFCPAGNCVGPGCIDTGGPPGSNPDDQTCRQRQTASYCHVDCSVVNYPASTTTACDQPDCTRTITACTATDSTTTTITTFACAMPTLFDNGNPDDQVPTIGDGGLSDHGDFDYPPSTVTITTTVQPPVVTVTQTVIVVPTVSADCSTWFRGFFTEFEVYNIQNWAFDHGSELRHQESGCGAITHWTWKDAGTGLARVNFYLPITLKPGCVERAIVSAGGPKISCVNYAIGRKIRRGRPTIDDAAANGPDDELRRKEVKALAELALRREAKEESEKNREKMQKRAATTEGPSPLSLTDTATSTYPSTSVLPTYVPMTWDANNTVILTWTLTDTTVSPSTYTFTSTIPGFTYTSNFTSSSPPTSTSSSSSRAPTATALPISNDGRCGANVNGNTCLGSTFGPCCSVKGNCGSTPAFCGVTNQCQAKYGTCSPVSTDGKCGAASTVGAMCLGSSYGDCCSVKGNCGKTPAFCGVSNLCQPRFGTCTPVSTNGKCGSASTVGAMCLGSSFGDCCSVKGNCGSTAAFCAAANLCQPMFGTCN